VTTRNTVVDSAIVTESHASAILSRPNPSRE